MSAKFEVVEIDGQEFRRYTKQDNLPSCRFVEGESRVFTEIATPNRPQEKGHLVRETVCDILRNAGDWVIQEKNLKAELIKKLPDFDWRADDREDRLTPNRAAFSQCFPETVSPELKNEMMDILNQRSVLQKLWGQNFSDCVAKVNNRMYVTPQIKLMTIVFPDENTAEITEVAEVRSYFMVNEKNVAQDPKNTDKDQPAFLTVTTTQRVSIVDENLTVDYTQMTYDVKASEEALCAAVEPLLSDEALGLVDSNLMNQFHAFANSDANDSVKAFAKNITETMKYGYPSSQQSDDKDKTDEYLARLAENLVRICNLQQEGSVNTAGFYEALAELAHYSDSFDRHMGLSGPNSSYAQVNAIISQFVPKAKNFKEHIQWHAFLNKVNDKNVNGYAEQRALFLKTLEYYKSLQARENRDNKENLQEADPIYNAGKELLADTHEAAKSVSKEGREHLATVLKYATENLQDLIEQQVHSGAVLRAQPVAMPERCTEEKYKRATTELQSGRYDKVAFSATRFLEAVATAVVNGFLLAVTAIANSAPSLLSSAPPATAPRFDMPSMPPTPSPAARRKEKMSGTLGLFFREIRELLKHGSNARITMYAQPHPQTMHQSSAANGSAANGLAVNGSAANGNATCSVSARISGGNKMDDSSKTSEIVGGPSYKH